MSSSVLILEDDGDLRTTLGDVLRVMCAAECVAAGDVATMIDLGDKALACSAAIIDINLGPSQPTGIDAYRWLKSHGFTGRIVFLTGHAGASTLIADAVAAGDAELVHKPASVRTLCHLIEGGAT